MAAVSFSQLLNGERAVVTLFIVIVLFSLPLSLLLHGVALSLLALFALSLEVRVETSTSLSQFKTRAGASSGLLLGAVTLPTFMLSKLIQQSRAFSLHQVHPGELNYLAMQYWAAFGSCFTVLTVLCLLTLDNTRSRSCQAWNAKFGLVCFVIGAALLFLCSTIGVHAILKLLWVFFHGFTAVELVQHLLNTFPSCVSFGEALLVTVGLVLYFGDMLAHTIEKIYGYMTSSELVFMQYGFRRSEIGIIIQGLLLGLLLYIVVLKYLLCGWDSFSRSTYFGARICSEKGKSLIFFASLGFLIVVIIPSWMQFVQDFDMHPLLWVVRFVFMEPVKRLSLCLYWVFVIYLSVLRFYNISKNSKIERILLRKYYHLMAVLMFLPAVILQPKFLDLAFGAALAVFLTLEIIRVWRIWPLGQLVHEFMNAFTDHRDSDLLIVSHFSLLLGCALPIWMSSGYNDRPLAPFAGILSLGIGDTMASMVGHKYGVLRWSKTGKKTIEGTAAGITSVLAACSVLLPHLASTGYFLTEHWISLLLAVTVSGLLEASTAQLDNAFIPLVFYSLLCL
ncbi:PREDICTED: dolichol kinase isoform X1 [Populus euphratica]|uniref:dolichol kinase n=1 Tax=Populus euphratica TaxID=75702 RepID=A0AAJ6X473_POPEU|nr:PREDICTED: dolichol kinase isoform X1 [Populus euphratica]